MPIEEQMCTLAKRNSKKPLAGFFHWMEFRTNCEASHGELGVEKK
jgi:hypothetical protein